MRNVELFTVFFKIGLFTFGGGYAMIPLIEREIVEKRNWLTGEELLDMVAIAESTPGPVAVNAATFVGNRVGGFFGAAAATIGVVLPSFLTITAIAYALRAVMGFRAVRYAFTGIRAGVLVLIGSAFVSLYRNMDWDGAGRVVLAAVFVLVAFAKVNPILVIAGAAAFGMVRSTAAQRKNKM